MTKEKLLENVREYLNEYWWVLDCEGRQNSMIDNLEEWLNKFEETVKKPCAGPQTPTSIDLQGIENAG